MLRKVFILIVVLVALLSACIAPQPMTIDAQSPSSQGATTHAADEDEAHDHEAHDHGMPQELGEVNFPISCSSDAQDQFNQGMAMLHSFWFAPAIHSFQEVAALDPTCGMAHWGIAMSLMGNPFTWPLAGQALVDGWAAVEMAAKWSPTADSPNFSTSQPRAVRALVMVSIVVKVFEATRNSVVSGLSSFKVSAICAPSTLEMKWARGPS